MSEYQYYEFLATDRPLTAEEMAELRDISSRARITPTSFANHYEWGDLKADPLDLLQRYFDVLVYVANWGTRWLALRLPRDELLVDNAQRYLPNGFHDGQQDQGAVVLSLVSEPAEMDDELDPDGDVDVTDDVWPAGGETGGMDGPDDGTGWMAALAPVREELLRGDLRPLYLGWLSEVVHEAIPRSTMEPPVPPGLNQLTAPQASLAQFLGLDGFLLGSAAEASPDEDTTTEGIEAWIAALPAQEKDRLLVEAARGREPHLGAALMRRFLAARPADPDTPRRSGDEIVGLAEERIVSHLLEVQRQALAERRRQEAVAAREREAQLNELAGRREEAWQEIERLVDSKRPNAYDRAVRLLQDLRDLALLEDAADAFVRRLDDLCDRHYRKGSFLERVGNTGLLS